MYLVELTEKQKKAAQQRAIREAFGLPAAHPLLFSSVTREGRDAVWDVIEEAAR